MERLSSTNDRATRCLLFFRSSSSGKSFGQRDILSFSFVSIVINLMVNCSMYGCDLNAQEEGT